MPAKILIVEDNRDSCAFLARLLELKGFSVMTAGDGEAALREVRDFDPDLVISDIMMPRLDGVGLVRELRRTPKYRDLPVLMVTAYGSGNVQEALRAGANEVIRKPLNIDRLFTSLRCLLRAPLPS